MPYAHRRKKIPRELDRRVKISEEKRAEIYTLFKFERLAQRAIARRTGVSRRMISYILFPDRLEVAKAQYKERRKDGRYYNKEAHTKAIREHGRYKQSIKDKLI